jgi:outer membrane protein OmpA-like peptidoglycan-associated protein
MRFVHLHAWVGLLLGSSAAAIGCAAYDVSEARVAGLRNAIDDATRHGAYRCAPRELAIARANLDFADLELAQGNPRRADQHLTEAETNVGAARLLSPAQRCDKAAVAVPELASRPSEDSDELDTDGDGIPDRSDRCRLEREDRDAFQDSDGCPELDNDGDGINDPDDACPLEAEDRDNFQDGDGCPERDNDGDGFEDPADDCPLVAGVPDNQGCPRKDYPGIVVTEKELRLTTPIVFERSTATIRSVSFPVLDSIVRALGDRPQMKLEIGGHTDSQGDDAANLKRSQAQAEAVMSYLVDHGVEASRLTARGYGETRPIESNSTSQGRAINRRIELVRTDRAP